MLQIGMVTAVPSILISNGGLLRIIPPLKMDMFQHVITVITHPCMVKSS